MTADTITAAGATMPATRAMAGTLSAMGAGMEDTDPKGVGSDSRAALEDYKFLLQQSAFDEPHRRPPTADRLALDWDGIEEAIALGCIAADDGRRALAEADQVLFICTSYLRPLAITCVTQPRAAEPVNPIDDPATW